MYRTSVLRLLRYRYCNLHRKINAYQKLDRTVSDPTVVVESLVLYKSFNTL
jgi:hypothetical protein